MMADRELKLTQSGYNFGDCCKTNFGAWLEYSVIIRWLLIRFEIAAILHGATLYSWALMIKWLNVDRIYSRITFSWHVTVKPIR
jgi:hypothetical protein